MKHKNDFKYDIEVGQLNEIKLDKHELNFM